LLSSKAFAYANKNACKWLVVLRLGSGLGSEALSDQTEVCQHLFFIGSLYIECESRPAVPRFTL